MASHKLKAASRRRQRATTPYHRMQQPKSIVQTVKDWLTPSKWYSQPEETPPPPDDGHVPWPGTPHPAHGQQLDAEGVTHPLSSQSPVPYIEDDDDGDDPPVIMVDSSVPNLASEREISTDEDQSSDVSLIPPHSPSSFINISTTSVTSSSCNGLVTSSHERPAQSPPIRYNQKVTLRPFKKPHTSSTHDTRRTLLTSTPYVSSLPSTNNSQSSTVSTRPSFCVSTFNSSTLTNLSLSRSPFYSGRTVFGGASSSGRQAAFLRKRARSETTPPKVDVVKQVIQTCPSKSVKFTEGSTVASSTALKILDTLQSMSSPLEDVRKLPLRQPTPYVKKRRINEDNEETESLLPPVSSLVTPSRAVISNIKQPLLDLSSTDKTPPSTSIGNDMPSASSNATSSYQAKSSGGKIKSSKHKTHYSSKNKDNTSAYSDQSEIPPHVPFPISRSGILCKAGPLSTITVQSPVLISTSYSFTSPDMVNKMPHPPDTPTLFSQFKFSQPIVVTRKTKPFKPKSAPPQSVISTTLTESHQSLPVSMVTSAPPISFAPPPMVPLLPMKPIGGGLLEALKKPEYQIENIRKEARATTSTSGTLLTTSGSSSSSTITLFTTGISTSSTVIPTTCGTFTTTINIPKLPTKSPLKWTCDNCWLPNAADKCTACGANKSITSSTSSNIAKSVLFATTSTSTSAVASSSSAKLPDATSSNIPMLKSSNSFGFNTSNKSDSSNALPGKVPPPVTSVATVTTPFAQFLPPTSNWECPSCMVSNKKELKNCAACGVSNPSSGSAPGVAMTTNVGGSFAPLSGGSKGSTWECPTCMIVSKDDVTKCPACMTGKPGGGATGSAMISGGIKLPVPLGGALSSIGTGGGMKLTTPLGGALSSSSAGMSGGMKLTTPLGGSSAGTSGAIKLNVPTSGALSSSSAGTSGGMKLTTPLGGALSSSSAGTSGGMKLTTPLGGALSSSSAGTSGGMKLTTPLGGALSSSSAGTGGGMKLTTPLGGALSSSSAGTSGGMKLTTPLSGSSAGTSGVIKLNVPTSGPLNLLSAGTPQSSTTNSSQTSAILTINKPNITSNTFSGIKFDNPINSTAPSAANTSTAPAAVHMASPPPPLHVSQTKLPSSSQAATNSSSTLFQSFLNTQSQSKPIFGPSTTSTTTSLNFPPPGSLSFSNNTSSSTVGTGGLSTPATNSQSKNLFGHIGIMGSGNTGMMGSGNTGTMGSGNTGIMGSGNIGTMGSGSTGIIGSGSTGIMGSGNTGTMAGNTGMMGSGNTGTMGSGNTGMIGGQSGGLFNASTNFSLRPSFNFTNIGAPSNPTAANPNLFQFTGTNNSQLSQPVTRPSLGNSQFSQQSMATPQFNQQPMAPSSQQPMATPQFNQQPMAPSSQQPMATPQFNQQSMATPQFNQQPMATPQFNQQPMAPSSQQPMATPQFNQQSMATPQFNQQPMATPQFNQQSMAPSSQQSFFNVGSGNIAKRTIKKATRRNK